MSEDSDVSNECFGEEIDGAWETNGCTCEDCLDYEDELIQHDNEIGYISDEQARARHAYIDSFRDTED